MEFSLLNFETMSAMQTIAISLLLELETECSGFFIIHPEIRSDVENIVSFLSGQFVSGK